MAVAFAFSSYAGKNIFMAYSPRINPNYLANLQSQFKKSANSVYLAFSSFKTTGSKKDVASVDKKTNSEVVFVTGVPEVNVAKIEPTTIPSNLFKSISKGVSAYEGGDKKVFRFDEGAEVKIGTIEVNGKKFQVIDLTKK